MEKLGTDPDEHLRSLDDDVRDDMVALDALIVAAMPERQRVVWQGKFWGGTDQSIIGYGDYFQARPRGDVEWFIIGLARQKNYISVYVNAVEDKKHLSARFTERLGKVKTGASNITFKRLADLDLDVFTELITEADRLSPPDR